MRSTNCFWPTVLTLLFLLACGSPPERYLTDYQKQGKYPNVLNVNVALLAKERNGKPVSWCSGFLIDREKGRFSSAKHCVGVTGRWRVFFHGAVYEGELLRVPEISDAAVLQVEGSIPSDVPTPYPIASETKTGDKVFIRGIHPHGLSLQKGKEIVPVARDYYGIVMRDQLTHEEKEHVFDNLEAKVVSARVEIKNEQISKMSPEVTAGISNAYLDLKTGSDHLFAFSGLSGGPIVNEYGELVGIVSNQKPVEQAEQVAPGIYILSTVWNTIRAVPASELERTVSNLK